MDRLARGAAGIDIAPLTRILTWWGLIASFVVLYVANLAAMHAVRAD